MAKVYLDEIEAALASTTCSSLTTDSAEGKDVHSTIDSFINAKFKLRGDQWDKVRTKLQTYDEALKQRMELATKLADAIKEALSILKDYLGEDMMLDTEQLPEYQKQRTICQNSIDTLRVMLTETETYSYTGSDGKTYTGTRLKYDTATVQAQITEAEETLKELDRIIKKIEGLDEVYAKAEGILKEAFSGIDSFKSSVSAIKPSGIYKYQPSIASSMS